MIEIKKLKIKQIPIETSLLGKDDKIKNHKKSSHSFDKEAVWKVMLKVAAPIVIMMLFNSAYQFIDSLMSTDLVIYGKINGTQLSGGTSIGSIFPLMNILLAIGVAVSVGSGYGYTKSIAERNRLIAKRILGQSFTLTFFLGIGVIFFTAAFGIPYIRTVTGNWHNAAWGQYTSKMTMEGYLYMMTLVVAFIPMVLQNTFVRTIRSEGKAFVASLIPVLTLPINVGFDYILMSPKIGNIGLPGAGIATLIASTSGLLMIFSYSLVCRKKGEFSMGFRIKDIKVRKPLLKLMWGYGFGSFYRRVLNGLTIIILTSFVGNLIPSPDILKATWQTTWTMMTRSTNMGSMVALGIGQAMSMLITYYWNSDQKKKAAEASKIGLISIFISSLLVAGLLIGLGPLLFQQYNISGGFPGYNKELGLSFIFVVLYSIPLSWQMGPLLFYSGIKSPKASWVHSTWFNVILVSVAGIFFVIELFTKMPSLIFIGITVGAFLGFTIIAFIFQKRYSALAKTHI